MKVLTLSKMHSLHPGVDLRRVGLAARRRLGVLGGGAGVVALVAVVAGRAGRGARDVLVHAGLVLHGGRYRRRQPKLAASRLTGSVLAYTEARRRSARPR